MPCWKANEPSLSTCARAIHARTISGETLLSIARLDGAAAPPTSPKCRATMVRSNIFRFPSPFTSVRESAAGTFAQIPRYQNQIQDIHQRIFVHIP